MSNRDAATWWLEQRDELLEIATENLNAYVYHLETIRAAAVRMLALAPIDRVLYAVKANYNDSVLRTLAEAGVHFDCVSPGEVEQVRRAVPSESAQRILFTPNFAPRDEYAWGVAEGLQVTLDNLYPLKAWPEIFAGAELFIRMDPGEGRGHHDHVRTGGIRSKFGVSMQELDELVKLVSESGAMVTGIHAHTGSGIDDPHNWLQTAEALVQAAGRFPSVRVLDLGGGISVPYSRNEPPFALHELEALLTTFHDKHPVFELWLEPGRYFVSEAGVLLTHVTQTKGKGDQQYVGVSTGMNALIRPALYNARHEIVNLSRIDEKPTRAVTVVGPICEAGDRLGTDVSMPACHENDVVLIANVGAYGQVMSSRYNLRDIPPEIIIG